MYAKDVATLFERAAGGTEDEVHLLAPRRGPGRPRKIARDQQP
jgi:hypothetical protein